MIRLTLVTVAVVVGALMLAGRDLSDEEKLRYGAKRDLVVAPPELTPAPRGSITAEPPAPVTNITATTPVAPVPAAPNPAPVASPAIAASPELPAPPVAAPVTTTAPANASLEQAVSTPVGEAVAGETVTPVVIDPALVPAPRPFVDPATGAVIDPAAIVPAVSDPTATPADPAADPASDPAVEAGLATDTPNPDVTTTDPLAAEAAAFADETWFVVADQVNLRAGEGTDFEKVGELVQGDAVTILSDPDADWVHVRANRLGIDAWIASKFILPVEPNQ